MLPRIGTFKSEPGRGPKSIRFTHVVMVDGEVYKGVCNRQPLTKGVLVPPGGEILCKSCQHRGWINTMGSISKDPSPRTYNGRINEKETIPA